MNIGSPTMTQIRDDEIKHAMIDTRAAVMTAFHTEHTVNDQHGDIHCTTISERSRTVPMGVWIPAEPQAATAFTASGAMTWSVPVTGQIITYTMEGNKMTLNIVLAGATVGGVVANILRWKIPNNLTAVSFKCSAGLVSDNTAGVGNAVLCFVRTLGNTTNLEFFRADLANFTASAANTTILAQIALEVR